MQLARSWRDLAGRLGIPEIIESGAGVLPGATTSHAVYDLGVAVSLALGDLAEAVDSYVDGPATLPDIRGAAESETGTDAEVASPDAGDLQGADRRAPESLEDPGEAGENRDG